MAEDLVARLRAEVRKGWRDIPQPLHKDHIMSHAADEIERLRARVAELERRKPAESPGPNASGFPDP